MEKIARDLIAFIKARGGTPCSIEKMRENVRKGMMAKRQKELILEQIIQKYANEPHTELEDVAQEIEMEKIMLQDKWLTKKLESQDRIDLGYLTPLENFDSPKFLQINWQFFRQFFTPVHAMCVSYPSWFTTPNGRKVDIKDFGEPEDFGATWQEYEERDHFVDEELGMEEDDFEGPTYGETEYRKRLYQTLFEQMLKVVYNPPPMYPTRLEYNQWYDIDFKIVSDVNRWMEVVETYPLLRTDNFLIDQWDRLVAEDMKRF